MDPPAMHPRLPVRQRNVARNHQNYVSGHGMLGAVGIRRDKLTEQRYAAKIVCNEQLHRLYSLTSFTDFDVLHMNNLSPDDRPSPILTIFAD